MNSWKMLFAALLLSIPLVACGDDDESKEGEGEGAIGEGEGEGAVGEGEGEGEGAKEGEGEGEGAVEGEGEGAVEGEGEGAAEPTCDAGYVCITFFIDDTNNKLMDAAANLEWKGSFELNPPDGNIIVEDGNWDGPFPKLYDDGPAPAGHEMPGAVAGDHIWSVVVKMATPDAEKELQYGAQALGNWIWNCANAVEVGRDRCAGNGIVKVKPEDEGKVIAADGLKLPANGTIDLKLVLDTAAMDPGFGTEKTNVRVKGSGWGWALFPCTEDAGAAGTWNCILGENVGPGKALPYSGLLNCGTDAQFVFVLGPDAGAEYKVGSPMTSAGETAYLKEAGGEWVEAAITNAADGDKNTMVTTPACQ